MTTSEQVNEIAGAAAKAQHELKPAAKDAKNPHFNSRYSDLAAIIEAANVYAKHGIAIFQDVTTGEAGVSVATRLIHSSGQWLEFGPLTVPMGKRDAHGVGSATTYAKRYGLQGAALIPSDDDDGNAATQSNGHASESQAPPAQTNGVMPPKYQDWYLDLLATADNGTAELMKAFNAAKPELRNYLARQENAKWEALKAKAAKARVPVGA